MIYIYFFSFQVNVKLLPSVSFVTGEPWLSLTPGTVQSVERLVYVCVCACVCLTPASGPVYAGEGASPYNYHHMNS